MGKAIFCSLLHAVGKEKIKSGVWVRNYSLFCIFNDPGTSKPISLSDRLPLSRDDYKWTWLHSSKHVTGSRLARSVKWMVGGRAMRCVRPVWPQKILPHDKKTNAKRLFGIRKGVWISRPRTDFNTAQSARTARTAPPSHAPLNTIVGETVLGARPKFHYLRTLQQEGLATIQSPRKQTAVFGFLAFYIALKVLDSPQFTSYDSDPHRFCHFASMCNSCSHACSCQECVITKRAMRQCIAWLGRLAFELGRRAAEGGSSARTLRSITASLQNAGLKVSVVLPCPDLT